MTDPYKVLGVKYDASDDEIKKASRTLSRQYHPDANVGKSPAEQAAAEERFKDVQQAYDQIMKDREQGIHGSWYENGGASGGSYSSYGGSSSSGWGYYGNPFGGQGAYGRAGYGQGTAYAGEDGVRMQAAASYINNGAYQEALHALDAVQDRTAQWYYFCSIAHNGLGNNANALSYARQAAAMDPDNIDYQRMIQMLEGGGQWYQDMSRGFGFGGHQAAGNDLCCYLCLANMLCGGCGGPVCCYI